MADSYITYTVLVKHKIRHRPAALLFEEEKP